MRSSWRSLQKYLVSLCLIGSLAGTLGLAAEPEDAAKRASASKSERQTVVLNQATVEQLQTLPGVGPSIARRIVEFRDQHGAFERLEDLMRVKGVGEKTFLKLKPHLKLGKSSG
ncbi:MAG: helix-hairpin-helix domain-containing protein [Acidobacteriota bacterium]|nr:helix-hairpin-helix domain-containing protein [Acidobacteriota bacterium]MDH3785423.1 helix-hairpin-helix domain-containing protein [Acidobacteriota bacterium]